TVSFDSNGGTAVADASYDFGDAVVAPADPTRTGYTFAGWSPTLPATMPANDVTVTAQWTINTFIVTFEDHDGTELKVETVDYGSDATAPAVPSRIGFSFTGWNIAFTN